jgi:hypothetical protein
MLRRRRRAECSGIEADLKKPAHEAGFVLLAK